MDLETLSNRILDGEFDSGFVHDDNRFSNEDDSLTHYGVKGMKWGVRKDRKTGGTKKKTKLTSVLLGKNRRYKDETAAQYQARMRRESNERIAKINAKQQAASERRTLKSQEKIAKMQIKAAEKERVEEEARRNPTTKVDSKSNKKQAEKSVKSMTDQEIRDAIARFRLEQDYKNEQRKANDMTSTVLKKTLKGAAVVGGGVLLAVGKQVATKQLADVGNQNLDAYLVKKGWKKQSTTGQQKKKE